MSRHRMSRLQLAFVAASWCYMYVVASQTDPVVEEWDKHVAEVNMNATNGLQEDKFHLIIAYMP